MISTRTLIFSFVAVLVLAQTSRAQPAPTAVARTMPPVIVIGFVGGFIRHDNLAHSEVQLAVRLRQAYPLGVDVETFESYHRGNARNRVLSLLDTNQDGTLTTEEKQNARIIIYGHSWGGSQAITLARELAKAGIPVLLTVQVDSVSRIHHDDRVIPANVAQAAISISQTDFYTASPKFGLPIPSAHVSSGIFDPSTEGTVTAVNSIPGTTGSSSRLTPEIECDDSVWKQAESLIRSYLPPSTLKQDKTQDKTIVMSGDR